MAHRKGLFGSVQTGDLKHFYGPFGKTTSPINKKDKMTLMPFSFLFYFVPLFIFFLFLPLFYFLLVSSLSLLLPTIDMSLWELKE
jgi:hypothetical protein